MHIIFFWSNKNIALNPRKQHFAFHYGIASKISGSPILIIKFHEATRGNRKTDSP